MRLQTCPDCGVVVNLDSMVNLKNTCSQEEFEEEKNKKDHYFLSLDGYESYNNGFYCPCCKKWVIIETELN